MTPARSIIVAILFAAATHVAAAPQARPPTLEPLDGCPPHKAACLEVGIFPGATDGTVIGTLPGRENYPEGATIVRIEGRLNGGPKRVYGLVDWTSPISCGAGGPVAYLGRSERNNPIILTKRGELEVFSDAVSFGLVDATLIDEQTGATSDLLDAESTLDSFIFDGRGGAYLPIYRSSPKGPQLKTCLKAPETRPGRLQWAPGRCKRSDGTNGLVPQERETLQPNARVAKILDDLDAIYGHELFRPYNRLWRVDGMHTLVIEPNVPCT